MSNYSIKSLYDVVRFNVLLKDKDLVHFTRTMHSLIREDFEKIKLRTHLSFYDITKVYENYTIVYMIISGLLNKAKISKLDENGLREITDLYLTDELSKITPTPPTPSSYNDED